MEVSIMADKKGCVRHNWQRVGITYANYSSSSPEVKWCEECGAINTGTKIKLSKFYKENRQK